jgi:hypothetical protein
VINFVLRLQSTYHWQCYTDFLNGYNLCCHQTEYMSPIVRPQGCTDLLCDLQLALEISKYLKRKGIDSILEDEASGNSVGRTRGQQLLFAVHKCHWFVILLTRKALEDDWITFSTLSALSDSIYKRKVRSVGPRLSSCRDRISCYEIK